MPLDTDRTLSRQAASQANHKADTRADSRPMVNAPKPAAKKAGQVLLRLPCKIGKYEVLQKIGHGTCGVVYKGFDPFVRRDVAIKIAHSEHSTDVIESHYETRAFFAEAYAAGRLQHPNIISLYDAGVEGDLNYIVMEYMEGETLLEYCRKNGKRLETETIIDAMFNTAKALDYSHQMGVIHRDIKPSNIMYGNAGEIKLMDFSIAEVTPTLAFTPESVIGSPSYMAPEQILRKEVTSVSDLYSLGAVMYQLLTGERPFPSDDVKQVFRDIVRTPAPLVRDQRPDLPEALSDIINKLLQKDPQDRFQTAKELVTQLTILFDNLRYSDKRLIRRENRHALKSLAFFNDFKDREIDEIIDASHMLTYDQYSTIIEEGDIDNSFYIIARGEAEVRKNDVLIEALNSGDCFGEIGFLVASKRTASVIATTDILVLKVNAILMDRVSHGCQLQYYKAFNETLIRRLALTSARLSSLQNY